MTSSFSLVEKTQGVQIDVAREVLLSEEERAIYFLGLFQYKKFLF